MADIDITQFEADSLIGMEKHCIEAERDWLFPTPGGRLTVALTSPDKRESFMLDANRAGIKLTKATYLNRVRQAVILCVSTLMGQII